MERIAKPAKNRFRPKRFFSVFWRKCFNCEKEFKLTFKGRRVYQCTEEVLMFYSTYYFYICPFCSTHVEDLNSKLHIHLTKKYSEYDNEYLKDFENAEKKEI